MPFPTKKWVVYSDFIPKNDLFDKGDFVRKLQCGSNLRRAQPGSMSEGFEAGYKPIIIIGSDCAALQSTHLSAAWEALQSSPYVLGPAKDGGYYLLGMRHFNAQLFTDLPWSTAEVAALTLARMPKNSCHMLPVLSDIDRAEDLESMHMIELK